jgi:hypothetical protein
MNKDYFEKVRSKNKEEWQSLLAEKWNDLRSWVQANGELGFAVGFIIGVIVVLAFKVVVALVAVAVLVGLAVWASASSDSQNSHTAPVTRPDDSTHATLQEGSEASPSSPQDESTKEQ